MAHDDLDRPSTWARWEAGLCEGCQARCCSLPVEASPEDLVRLGFLAADQVRGSMRKMERELALAGIVRGFREGPRTFFLQKRPSGDCIFQSAETRKCTVYETRPEVCRSFPDVGPRLGFCPAQPAARKAAAEALKR